MTDIEDLALRIKQLEDRVGSRNATQIDSSSVDVGDDDSLAVADVVASAAQAVAFDIPGLQELLDTNAQQLQDAAAAVQEAIDAADAATEAGLVAGEEASAAADDALEKAQEALDAAAAAGGGATYTGRAPTSDDPGVSGQQWFVWDVNYKITAYYVYNSDISQWVQTEITDAVLGNIDAGSITSGYIGAERIAAASLTAAVFAADAITSREIAADAILGRNIKAAEITGAKIAAATITGGNIAANTITAGNIKAGTITANEIAAGTITATQINLDTLNGKTITGATYRSAASGARIEISNTWLKVFSNTSTDPVGYLYANDGSDTSGTFSFVSIINNYSSTLGGSGLYVTPPRNPKAGSYESARKVNVTLTDGVDAPAVQANLLLARGRPTSKYPVMSSTVTNGSSDPIAITSDSYQIGMNAGTPVIFTSGNVSGAPVVVQPDQFRSNNTADVSLSSFNHALQIGPDTGTNLAMDNNEIMVRNNGGTSSLFIQGDGGSLGLGNSSSTVSIPGSLNYAGHVIGAFAAGIASYSGDIAGNRGSASLTINFPSGRFSSAPVVSATPANTRIFVGVSSVSATRVILTLVNTTDANAPGPIAIHWMASDAG